jgi:vacuolar protein sorting-associated protein 13A/C
LCLIGVLGAPIGFVGSLGSGVKSFFVEPAKAIRKGPKDFAKGMKKGTYGLLSNTFEGFGSAAGAVSGALGDGVAQLTFDEEFQASRQERDQAVAEGGFKNGVYYGGKAFASSFASGIKGLAYAPVKGAREGGISGFVKGVGKGIVGVPTKIVSGALEGVSHVAEGAANSAINQREGAGTVRKRAARAT